MKLLLLGFLAFVVLSAAGTRDCFWQRNWEARDQAIEARREAREQAREFRDQAREFRRQQREQLRAFRERLRAERDRIRRQVRDQASWGYTY
jgi:hypothetical protein